MSVTISFVIGWNYGKTNKVELSAAEIAIRFPDVEADAFAQGNMDGMLGNRFQLEMALKAK